MREVFCFLCLLIFSNIQAPTIAWEWTDIDMVILDFMQLNEIPGLYFGYVNGTEMVTKGYGYSDLNPLRPADNTTRVFIASISKSFTAVTVCCVLSSKFPHLGEAVLDTPIVELVPSYNLTLIDRHRTERVTFRDLLSHRTCLNINSPVGGGRAKVWKSREDFIYRIRYLPQQCDFRSRFVYSGNAMLTLAGDIVGHIVGVSFDSLVTELLKEIGMEDSLTETPTEDYETLERMSRGYFKNLDGNVERMNVTVAVNLIEGPASGGVISTATDMAKYLTFHLGGGYINGKQVVPKEVMAWVHKTSNIQSFPGTAMSDGDLAYALGLEWGVFHRYSRLGHNGNLPPFTSRMTFYPELKLGLYTTTNGMATWQMHVPVHKRLMEVLTGTSSITGLSKVDFDVNTWDMDANPVVRNPVEGEISQIDRSELVGIYGHPYEGDVKIVMDSTTLKLEYGVLGRGTLSSDGNNPNIYTTEWGPEMVSIFVATNSTNLLTEVRWDFSTPNVLTCLFPGGSLEYKKDATIDTYPPIPWIDINCENQGVTLKMNLHYFAFMLLVVLFH